MDDVSPLLKPYPGFSLQAEWSPGMFPCPALHGPVASAPSTFPMIKNLSATLAFGSSTTPNRSHPRPSPSVWHSSTDLYMVAFFSLFLCRLRCHFLKDNTFHDYELKQIPPVTVTLKPLILLIFFTHLSEPKLSVCFPIYCQFPLIECKLFEDRTLVA